MTEPFIGEIRSSAFNSHRRAGRCATANCCRSTRTRRSFRFSAPPTAATGRPPLPCPTCRAAVPFGVGAGYAQGQQGGRGIAHADRAEMPPTPTLRSPARRRHRPARLTPPGRTWHSQLREQPEHADGRQRRGNSGWQPTARKPLALPDGELLYCLAGDLPVPQLREPSIRR